MTDALGQLDRAPLIYVLTQISFTRVPKMSDLWEELHARLFSKYPESDHEQVTLFSFQKDELETVREHRWHMVDREQRQGLVLKADSAIFHTTRYTTSENFFADLETILGHLVAILPSDIRINRLGLRYVDLLVPTSALDVNRMVVEALREIYFYNTKCTPVRYERSGTYACATGGELTFRHRQTTGMDVLPNDLFPNRLKPAPLLETPKPEGASVGLLDFDHYVKQDMMFRVSEILKTLRTLQKTASMAFRDVTTAEAMAYWKGESNGA